MFTGIVEEVGTVRTVSRGAHSATLTIEARTVLEGTKLGDSIAVNGVCLTVTALGPRSFSADVMHETLRRSDLGALHAGSPVNLERALAANGRFGGHIVSGHIDAVGTIRRIERDDNAVWYTIGTDRGTLRSIIMKGSITVDGISLTVARLTDDAFAVSIIPHTRAETILPTKHVGDAVNLETDVIGKYVERFLTFSTTGAGKGGAAASAGAEALSGSSAGHAAGARATPLTPGASPPGGLTPDFLAMHGF